MHVARAAVDEFLDELGQVGTSSPVSGQISDLLLRGNLAGQEQPEETFWERLLTTRGLWEDLLTFGNCLASESNSLF
jgi:hypothetical protein